MPLTPEPPARGAELEDRHVHRLVLPVHLRAKPYAHQVLRPRLQKHRSQHNTIVPVLCEMKERKIISTISAQALKSQRFQGIWLRDCASHSGAKWLFECFWSISLSLFKRCPQMSSTWERIRAEACGSMSSGLCLCREEERPVFYCVDRWLLLPGVPHLCIHQGFVPSSDPGWPFSSHRFSLPFNMNGSTRSPPTPGCVIPLKHTVKPNLERRWHKWQGDNNRKPTAKCPTNLERTNHDVKTEWNKSMSTAKLCRPHGRVKNNGKELSAEVHKTDR